MNPQRIPFHARKIAVLRANALGDYIFAIPALMALRNAYPQAEIVYLGNRWHQRFLENRPGPVDRFIAIPKCHGVPDENDRVDDPAAVAAFFDAMRAEAFDIALQMHGGGGNSNPFVTALGARLAAGLRAEGAPPLDINVPYVMYHNEMLRQLEVVASIGAAPVSVTPRLVVTDADRHALNAEITPPARPYVVIHPGASDIRRRWSAAKMAMIADVLHACGFDVCITGVESEARIAAEVASKAACRPRNLCGALSLHALTALLDSARLLIANDTGPLHLARAIGTPTVGIYWIGNLVNYGAEGMRLHRHATSWTTQCPDCGMDCIANDMHIARDGCRHEASIVDSISVEQVAAYARALLDEETQHASETATGTEASGMLGAMAATKRSATALPDRG